MNRKNLCDGMATLRSLAVNRASEEANGQYGHLTRAETYLGSARANGKRPSGAVRSRCLGAALWRCSYCTQEPPGLILSRCRGHFAGEPILATASWIAYCATVHEKVAEFRDAAAQKADGK